MDVADKENEREDTEANLGIAEGLVAPALRGKKDLILLKQTSVGCVRGRNAETSVLSGTACLPGAAAKSMIRGSVRRAQKSAKLTHSKH